LRSFRSAAFLLRHALEGIGDKLFQLQDGEEFLEKAFQTLNTFASDSDKLVRFHCEVGLGVLEQLMRAQLQIRDRKHVIDIFHH
jgi:hypothetical protein